MTQISGEAARAGGGDDGLAKAFKDGRNLLKPCPAGPIIFQKFFKSRGGVEIRQLAGEIFFVTDINIPDYFSIGGIKKRHPISVPITHAFKSTLGVSFGLFENIIGTHAHLLGFYNSQ